jgi:hypothetical protein
MLWNHFKIAVLVGMAASIHAIPSKPHRDVVDLAIPLDDGAVLAAVDAAAAANKASYDGQCPIIFARAEIKCRGQTSTCWSPGHRNVDCADHELCCFDGCRNHCSTAPKRNDGNVATNVPATVKGRKVSRCETVYKTRYEDILKEECKDTTNQVCMVVENKNCREVCRDEYDVVKKTRTENRCRVTHVSNCKEVEVVRCAEGVMCDKVKEQKCEEGEKRKLVCRPFSKVIGETKVPRRVCGEECLPGLECSNILDRKCENVKNTVEYQVPVEACELH